MLAQSQTKIKVMKKMFLLTALVIGTLLPARTYAQTQAPSLKNTNWKLFVPDLNDTITLHIKTDSSFVTSGNGDVVLRSVCKVWADTLSFTDYDGQYACNTGSGKYKINLSDDLSALTLTLIDDPCDGRANAINNIKWLKAAPPANAQK
jgi:hypothetical protein